MLLTVEDIIFAALAALVLTWLIKKASAAFKKLMMTPTQFGYRLEDYQRILRRCCTLFPREIIKFKGEVFKRGMNIQLKTTQSRTFEGQFIGINRDNMVCLLNKKFVLAQDIKNIEEIILIKSDPE